MIALHTELFQGIFDTIINFTSLLKIVALHGEEDKLSKDNLL